MSAGVEATSAKVDEAHAEATQPAWIELVNAMEETRPQAQAGVRH